VLEAMLNFLRTILTIDAAEDGNVEDSFIKIMNMLKR